MTLWKVTQIHSYFLTQCLMSFQNRIWIIRVPRHAHPNLKTRTAKEWSRAMVKVVLWSSGGAHLTKTGWSKPHTHDSYPTNLALFRHKITLWIQSGGLILLQGAQMGAGGWAPSPLALTTGLKLQFVNKVNSTFWCVNWALAREW